jgi:hypothetical protein
VNPKPTRTANRRTGGLCFSAADHPLDAHADEAPASWRLPLGDAGILDFALGILAMDNVSQPLRMHSLRLIGNCCADTG